MNVADLVISVKRAKYGLDIEDLLNYISSKDSFEENDDLNFSPTDNVNDKPELDDLPF